MLLAGLTTSLTAGLIAACGDGRGASESGASAPPAAAVAAPRDSLALRTAAGTELWFTLAREDRDSIGAACLERTLEIRNGDRKIPIPLLYTRDVPKSVNESTVTARVWNRCAPGDEYRINLRTGQPAKAQR